MKRFVKNLLFIVVLTVLISPQSVAEDEIIEKMKENLMGLSGLLVSNSSGVFMHLEDKNTAKYFVFDSKSFEYLSPNDERYQTVIKHQYGSGLKSVFGDTYMFQCVGKDVWNNNEYVTLYISVSNSFGDIEYNIFDGNRYYKSFPFDPGLADMGNSYYISWNDKSGCPLHIYAYQIDRLSNGVNVSIVVRNLSKKTIVGFEGTFLMYDKMGNPVRWGGGDNKFRFIDQDSIIRPSEPTIQIGTWVLRLYDNTRKVKPYIRVVLFEDGSKWVIKARK